MIPIAKSGDNVTNTQLTGKSGGDRHLQKFKNLINWFFRINLALAAAVVITSIFFWVYFTSSLFFAPFGVCPLLLS